MRKSWRCSNEGQHAGESSQSRETKHGRPRNHDYFAEASGVVHTLAVAEGDAIDEEALIAVIQED